MLEGSVFSDSQSISIHYDKIYNMYTKTGLYLNLSELQKVHKRYIRIKIYCMRHKVTQNI